MPVIDNVPTSDIRVGDIVITYGMRVRIDRIKRYHGGECGYSGKGRVGHPFDNGVCLLGFTCSGTVLNVDEVRSAGVVPIGWLRTYKFAEGRGPVIDRSDFWNVQGNNLAQWTVERN